MRRTRKLGIAALLAGCLALAPLGAAVADDAAEAGGADDVYVQYAPQVTELEDGTLVMRTPDEGLNNWTLEGSYTYHLPANNVPYNTYYLKADQRGCNACHADLAETLDGMIYEHVDLGGDLGIQVTLQMCLDCHTFGYGYITNQYSFGSLIHGIHSSNECWTCHIAEGDGDGMQLWDLEKHTQLRGISGLPEVAAEFSWDQDKTTARDDLFDFGWVYFDLDYLRADNSAADAPLDQEMFDTWTITVSGAVDQETTWTLPELIDQFESVEVPLTLQCTLNPTGGPLIGNAVYTGIRISDVLAACGASEDAGALTFMAPDGFAEPLMMEHFTEGYIVYRIDGEPLPWGQGYPVASLIPHAGAPASVKELSDIVVNTADEAPYLHEWNGWPVETEGEYYTPEGWPENDENGYVNKPNVGIFDFAEGTVVETGEPFTISGYADGYNLGITALQFSLDNGVNWTEFDTSGSNKDNWVIWHLTYTPEFDSAYVLSVRAVGEDGSVTAEPIEVMFNAVTGAYTE